MVRLRRLGGVAGLLVFVGLLAAPAGLVQAALDWQIETVDEAGDVGLYTSLAMDATGQPHISYLDYDNGDLKYAAFDGTTWQIETVDAEGDVGYDSSLALDSSGRPHISYFDVSNANLKYATFDGSTWRITTVDADGKVGNYTSLALDNQDQPHIGYTDYGSDDLKYATFDGSTWQIETVDTEGDVGAFTSLALNSAGQPRISYLDLSNVDLMYAVFDGDDWVIETVDWEGEVGYDVSLALDSAGQPHISYLDLSNANLKYAFFDGSTWQITTVDADGDAGYYTSLAVDNQDHPHISYFDASNNNLKYATFDGSTWQIETVEAEEFVGYYTSVALDSTGEPHISYLDLNNTNLKYAQVVPNQPPNVNAGGPYSGTEGASISLDATVSDPENDALTTAWTYDIDNADDVTACTFADPTRPNTILSCTDAATVTLTLEASDGINPPVSDTAIVTISNANPTITSATAALSGSQVNITVDAVDPGENDVLSYAFDCDNDTTYETATGTTSSATCPLNPQYEGSFTFGVQVSDDDGGIATGTVTVTVATALCANDYTGVLRYSDTCRDHETPVTIPDAEPVEVCANGSTDILRLAGASGCSRSETRYVLPADGPLHVCINGHTEVLRVVDSLSQCASHEFGRVIAATEVGEATPPRSR